MKKFNTQFVNQTPSYSPLTDFDHYIPEKHPTSLQFVPFEKGKENLNNNDPLLSSNRPHRGHYKANQQLRQSVHDLLNEMEHALDPKDQRKPIDKYYERRLQRESIEKSPKSNDKRLLSTMEIGSYQKRNEDLITDRTQKTNAQFQGFGIKPALIKIRSLPQLQISITQQILMLRQQKITLMHRKNSIIDQKNEIFRQVAKLKRICQKQVNTRNQSHKQRSQDTEGIKRKSSLQDQNQYLKNKIEQQNQLCIPDLKQEDLKKAKQNQQKLLFQIQKYQRLCNFLQQQLQKRQMKFANRFQTFLPSQKHIKSKQQNKNEKNNKLWNNEQLLQLRLKNRKLMNEANTMIAQKRSYHIEPNINILEQIVQMNKMIKQGFFQEVRCYKIQIPKLKTQNMKMKRALHNF